LLSFVADFWLGLGWMGKRLSLKHAAQHIYEAQLWDGICFYQEENRNNFNKQQTFVSMPWRQF